jgi:hypothetical protein
MPGPNVLGRTLRWHAIQDPEGGRGLSFGDEILAEMWWSPSDGGVRAEAGDAIWTVDLAGARPIRGQVRPGAGGAPIILYVGGVRRGLARSREGAEFELFANSDLRRGPWMGVDHVGGDGVLRVRGRLGRGGFWSEISVTPDVRFRSVAWPLVLLWGSLRILRGRRPLLGFTANGMAEEAVRTMLDELSLAGGTR